MPGIHEENRKAEAENVDATAETLPASEQSESSSTLAPMDDSDESEPPKEANQTDKLNNFLLKSFLNHINTQSANIQMQSSEDNVDDSNDWS